VEQGDPTPDHLAMPKGTKPTPLRPTPRLDAIESAPLTADPERPGSEYISDEEDVKFQQKNITESIRQHARIAQNRARLVGNPISFEEAVRRVRTTDTGLRVNPVTGEAVANGDVYTDKPFTSEQVLAQAKRKFPLLAMQAEASGLTREEQTAAVSLPLAVEAVKLISTTANETRKQQIINTMGPDMQALVVDVYEAWAAESQKRSQKREEGGETADNFITNSIGFFWDHGIGQSFDMLIEGVFKMIQGGLAVSYMSGGNSPSESWTAAEPGTYDQSMVDYSKEYFGVEITEVIMEAKAAQNSEDPPLEIAKLWDKYSGLEDLNKLSILEQALGKSAYNQKVLNAETYLASADTGNMGNALNWSFGSMRGWGPFSPGAAAGEPGGSVNPLTPEGVAYSQSSTFTGARDITNVVSLFAYDPLRVTGAAKGGYTAMRYGFKQMDALDIATVFQQKATRNFFDSVGAGLTRADNAADAAQSAQVMNSLRSQYKKWFTADALQALKVAGVRSADDAATFFDDAKNLEYMVAGQTAKRAKQLVIPHMITATAGIKRISLLTRGLTYDRNAATHIDEIFGPGVSALLPAEALPIIINKLKSKDGEKFVGQFLSDFVYANGKARRTWIGTFVDKVKPTAMGDKRRYGYKRENGRKFLERQARLMAHVPDLGNGINIATGKDAYKIRDMMMFAGMPKYWADYSAEMWRVMKPGERKLFATGIGRSMGYAMGIDMVDPIKGASIIDTMVTGARLGEKYAPDYIDMPAVRAGVARQADMEDSQVLYHYGTKGEFVTPPPRTASTGNIQGPAFYTSTSKESVETHSLSRPAGGTLQEVSIPQNVINTRLVDMSLSPSSNPSLMKSLSDSMEASYVTRFGSPSGVVGVGDYSPTYFAARIELVNQYESAIRKATSLGDNATVDALAGAKYDAQMLWSDAVTGQGYLGTRVAREGGDEIAWFVDPMTYGNSGEQALGNAASKAPMSNNSMMADGTYAALYQYQMADNIGMPNMQALSALSMRQSYLTALLGQGPMISRATDIWTLGTLGGPRFFLRNGLEDAGLYALTNGSWSGFRQGQMWSKAKREATQRVGTADTMGQKLGLLSTASRYLGDTLPKSLQLIILPHASKAEIKAAAQMSALNDRAGLVSLIRKLYMRQKGMFIVPNVRNHPDSLRYLDEAADSPQFAGVMDDASETPENLINGSMPGGYSMELNRAIVAGEYREIRGVILPFKETMVTKSDPDSIAAWRNNINSLIHADGVYGPQAMQHLKAYHKAVSTGDVKKVDAIVKSYAKFIDDNLTAGMETSAIYMAEGSSRMARRKLQDASRIFSAADGTFNLPLYEAIRRVEIINGKRVVTFRMYDMKGKEMVPRITEEMLIGMPMPTAVLSAGDAVVPIINAGKVPWTQAVWSAMGRSLARFTREPIFIANYLEARKFIQPIETRLAAEYGEAYAKKWAVEAGYERAFTLTMSYVDDPNVRSQMAWSVRNVSRFYRAQEDFFRRMMRTAKNNPMAIERLNLSWHALDETGFVNQDENGNKIFVWPGNKVTFKAINWFTETFLDKNVLEGGAMMDFTSDVTRLTPSADPNALPLTLSGPYMALAVPALMTLFPALGSLKEEISGDYSANNSWMDQVIPTFAANGYELVNAMLGRDQFNDNDTRFADSARSAMQIWAASGVIDESKKYSGVELSKMKEDLQILGVDISIIKSLAGPSMPASISINPQDVTNFAKSLGISGMRKVFIELLQLNDNDFNMALTKWTKANPGLSVFTVSENENPDSFGMYKATAETQVWIENNMDLFEKNSKGASFYAPQEGVNALQSWKYLASMGAKIPKQVDHYFNEMITSKGYTQYKLLQDAYYREKDRIALIPDVGQRKKANTANNEKWTGVKKTLYIDYPQLSSRISGELSTSGLNSPDDYRRDITDIKAAGEYMKENGNLDERGQMALDLISIFESAQDELLSRNPFDAQYKANRARVKDRWERVYEEYSIQYPDDTQWRLLMNATSGVLGFEVG